jgi:hypothetical protein
VPVELSRGVNVRILLPISLATPAIECRAAARWWQAERTLIEAMAPSSNGLRVASLG